MLTWLRWKTSFYLFTSFIVIHLSTGTTVTALNIKVLKPANVKGTWWIPQHEQAAKAIKQDWPCLLAHLDSVSIKGQSADAKAKAL